MVRDLSRKTTNERIIQMKKKIYISGPISGYDIEERRETFATAKKFLEIEGYEVCNPLENGLPSDADTHQHMRADLKMLVQCDEIFLLNKWNHSAGCFVEFMVAVAIGCKLRFCDMFTSIPERKIFADGFLQSFTAFFK